MTAVFPSAPSLAPLVDSFRAELDQIEGVFYSVGGTNTVDQYRIVYAPAEDGCLVSLWDAWNRFVRRLLLTCSSGQVLGLAGGTYSPTVPRAEPAAIAHILANRRNTNIRVVAGEPYWYDVTAAADFTQVLGLANGNEIVNALTATTIQLGAIAIPNPLEEIRICRNFVAHKGDGTLGQVAGYSAPPFESLRRHVRTKRYGVEVFSDWKEGCLAIAVAAAQ